ncbi:MAG: PAS domain S-box protein [Chloroflexi bacterium]|nr:PAS domain S-box protein [Chloroflexota bacterium]
MRDSGESGTTPTVRPRDLGFGRLFWRIPEAVVVGDANSGRIVLWNPAAEALFGYSAAEAVGMLLEVLVPDRLKDQHRAGLARFRAGGHGAVIDAGGATELPALHKTGEEIHIELSLSPVESTTTDGRFVLALIRDITARKRLEDDLDREREFLKAVLQNLEDGIVACNADGVLTLFNRATREFHGLPESPLPSEQWAEHYDLYLPDGQTRMQKEDIPLFRALEGETVRDVEMVIAPKHGDVRTLSANGQAIFDSKGQKLGAVVVMHDVTQRKRAEAARAEMIREQATRALAEAAQRRFAFLAEASTLLAASLDYEVTLASVARLTVPYLANWCVVDMVEDDGSICRLEVATDARHELARELQRFPPDLDASHPVPRALQAGQSQLWTEISDPMLVEATRDPEHLRVLRALDPKSSMAVPLHARGRILGVLTFTTTEPQRRYGPADLALAEDLARRAALAVDNARLYREARDAVRVRDEFLQVAAHELKTPVTSLRGFAQLTMRQLDRDEDLDRERVRHALQRVDQQSTRLSRLVSQLLDVTWLEDGRLALERSPTDVAGLVRGVIAAAQARTSRHTIVVHAPTEVSALVDPLRLEQVVTNLLDNAIKFSPNGGPIDVEVTTDTEGLPIETVRLTVTDAGIGIKPEQRERIFERFSRPRADDRTAGMGLGLYLSRQVVDLHGGQIRAESPAGGGARLVVDLPIGLTSGSPAHVR